MASYPPALRRLIEAFLVLPGIGRRTAERFAFSLLERAPLATRELADALGSLHAGVVTCASCGQFTAHSPCSLCADSRREADVLCVVADSRTIQAVEQTGSYHGRYFVLGGLLNPLEGVRPEQLRTAALAERVASGAVREVILAFNATVEGDTTALYLTEQLQSSGVAVTRLARGLPTGSRLEYADEQTVADALLNRRPVGALRPAAPGKV